MIEGVMTLLDGFRLLLGKAELRAVLWRMLGLLALLMLVLTGGVFYLTDTLVQLWLPEGDAWYWQMMAWVVGVLAFLLALLTGVACFAMLASAAVAPWLDDLAERSEQLHGMKLAVDDAGWVAQVFGSLANSLRPLMELLLWGVLALALFLIPFIGQVPATLIWGYAGIRFLNYELMDTVASRRGWRFKERREQQRGARFFWLGFGGLAMALMLVPMLNLLVLPAAVVGLARRLPA